MPTTAAIALGSNLGDRSATLRSALAAIAAIPGVRLLAASDFFETEPVGPVPQGAFLNAAAVVETDLPARALLDALLAIEQAHGRIRSHRWGPRTLDLDLLLVGDAVIHETGLAIPHPRLQERLFVLEPLASIAPDLVVPTLGRTVGELRDIVRGSSPASTPP